jgi:hypothetical protein
MKHKIIITESQYNSLVKNLDEQGGRFEFDGIRVDKNNPAPKWLSAIIGNKQEGYTIALPPSSNVAEVDELLKEGNVNVDDINKDDKLVKNVTLRLGGNADHFRRTMLRTNPKYRALILSKYKTVSESGVKGIAIKFGKTLKKSTSTDATKPTSKPGGEDPIYFKFPVEDNLTSKKYFVDNSWELDPVFVEQFRSTTLKNIKDKLATIPNPKGLLNGITVKTSCSTLPNGKSPDGKVYSFADLSKLRNQSAKEFVVKELESIGVTILPNLKYTDDYMANDKDMGGLGNGSSSRSGNIWGQPGASKDKKVYELDKYLKIALDLVISGKDKYPVDPSKTPGITTTTTLTDYDYTAALGVPDIPYKIPGIDLAWKWDSNTKSKCRAKNSQMKCETWGEGPKSWADPYFYTPWNK